MSEILVGFDGTPGADDALAFATTAARATAASIRLVHVNGSGDVRTQASDEQIESVADDSPARGLRGAAERSGAALIVVGSTHRGRLGRVLPGSTGERLLHGAPCAVAIVPRGYAQHADGIASIAVGYDASDESAAALRAACVLARRFGAALRVVHVFDAGRVGQPALMTGPAWSTMRDGHEAAQREELEQAVAALPKTLDARTRFIIDGRPGRELARESEAVDLMVLGAHGYAPLTAVLLGGVSHGLIAHAACPVIVLPRGAGGREPFLAGRQ